MSLLDAIRSGVKTINDVTKELQASVQFERFLGEDGYGTKTFSSPVSLLAIVDWKQRQLRTPMGTLTVSRASVLFLDTPALAQATNGNGVSDDDRITLPDGTTGPILDMSGFIDAGTGHPVTTEVWLG